MRRRHQTGGIKEQNGRRIGSDLWLIIAMSQSEWLTRPSKSQSATRDVPTTSELVM